MDKALNSAKQFSQRTTTYLKNIENAANNINSAAKWEFRFNNIDRVKSLGSQIFQLSDSHTELANKIKLVTETEAQHAQAMASVYDISMKTAQSTQAVSAVYQSFAQNAKELGINQRQVASVTETISKAVAISGASTAEAQNALTQFSQTLLMGKMRAQEYNSIMTQTPAVMQAIARGLGVTMGQLKEMSDKGELTTDKMIQALEKSKKSVDELYGKTATTISGAMQNLSTATEKFVGNLVNSTGVANGMASAIGVLANNLNYILPTITSVGVTFAGIKLFERTKETIALSNANREVAATQAQVAHATLLRTQQDLAYARVSMQSLSAQLQLARTEQQRALIRTQMQTQAAQIISLTNAETAATVKLTAARQSASLLSGALSMVGGPLGLLTIGLTAGATWLYNWHQEAEQARQNALEFANELPRIKENIEAMNSIDLRSTKAQLEESAEVQQRQVDQLKRKVQELKQEIENTPKVKVLEADGYEFEIDQTQKIIRMQRELDKTIKELNDSEIKLNDTKQTIATTMEQMPVAELKARFAELYPNIEQSKIKVDGLNVSIGNFTFAMPSATAEALKFAGAIGTISQAAMQAAVTVANLPFVQGGGGIIDPKNLEMIEKIERRNAIDQAKGNDKVALQVKDALINSGMKEGDAGYQRLKEAYEKQFAQQALSKGGGGGKGGKTRSGADYRKDFDGFFDDLKKTNADTLQNIDISRANSLEKLNKLMKTGVVAHEEAEKAKVLITQRYLREREELAERYAPHLSAKNKMQRELYDIQQLQSVGSLSNIDARNAGDKAKFEYAQTAAQNAVSVQDQIKGMYDPNQEQLNRQTQELAQLDAFHQTQLLKEEEFQKLKQQIIDRYANDKFQTEMRKYAEGLNTLGSAFGDLTSVIEQAGGKQSAAYKAMFAIQKSFAIAEATINVTRAASQVMTDWSTMNPAAKFAAVASVMSQGMALVGQIRSVGFATGGYTGDGGKYTPAGIVHRGEYVITKEATSRLGLDYLNYLNYGKRGFATGGGVGVPRVPSTPTHFGGSQNVTVTVINNGKPTSAEVETQKDGQDLAITVKLMEQIADGVYRRNQTRDLRSGGALNR
ncbi:tape measure protein [Glaesserella sp.]